MSADPSKWVAGKDDKASAGTGPAYRKVSYLGGTTLYVMIPAILNTYQNNPSKFCIQYWTASFYNTYTFTLKLVGEKGKTLTCELDRNYFHLSHFLFN